jgi:hypothetical protein
MTTWVPSFRVVICAAGVAACGYPALPSLTPDIDAPPNIDAPTDTEPPGLHVAQTVPSNGATAVQVTAPIVIMFNKPLDTTTVTATSAVLTAPGGTSIPATVAGADQMITLTPTQRLPGNAFMTAKVTTQVHDAMGNALTADFSWTFTTGYGTTSLFGAQEFTVRDSCCPPDGTPDVFVGGTPPPPLLFIKKGTEDRSIVEFDISQFPTDVMSARLEFDSKTLDPGGPSTRIQVYIFDGNGVADLSDFSRTETLFGEDFGANDDAPKSQSYDVTSQLENARTRGVSFLGFLLLAADTNDRFDLITSNQDPNTGAPRLIVTY